MRDELLANYERELTFLRQMGAEFAKNYPKVASRLQLEPGRCEDPHVERLIEAVALLAARIHLRLDDDFPEITQALLNTVYPHYTRPIPSMSVAEFQLREGKLTTSYSVPRDATLYSKPVDGVPCTFRTCYPTEVWPLTISDAQWTSLDRLDPPIKAPGVAAALRLRLDCWPGAHLPDLTSLDTLRFFLSGEPALVHTLYELLCGNCRSILLRDPRPKFRRKPIELIPDALRPVGFEENEALLPSSPNSLSAYRLLQEYFAFPDKFFFLDLRGMDAARTKFQDSVEIVFLISPFERSDRQEALESGVNASTFRLGCTPIINLFEHTAEPIQMDQTKYEYRVSPNFRHNRSMEVFSVKDVVCAYESSGEQEKFESFYSFRHSTRHKSPTFWNGTRRPAGPGLGDLTEIHLSLVDLSGRPVTLNLDTLTVRCLCSNGDLPPRLAFGNPNGDFDLEGSSAIGRIVSLRKPTPTLRPALAHDALWRLISHLSLNYLSLVEGGREALQEILRLYQGSSTQLEQQVDGILDVRSERRFARVIGEHGISYVRGVRVELELDEERFVGGGVYLFSSVLEHFLAQYVSMNSFSQLAVKTRQRKEILKEWAPRAGNRILL